MTRLFVLGFLNIKPLSGYDIQQILLLNDTERWGGVLVGSIYHALKKMEKEELIEVDSIEHTGHRQKAIYRITPRGKEHFIELLAKSLAESSAVFPSSLYTALSFIDNLPKEQVITALEKQYEFLENETAELQKGLIEKRNAMGELPSLSTLVFNNMFDTYERQKTFIKEIISVMKSSQ